MSKSEVSDSHLSDMLKSVIISPSILPPQYAIPSTAAASVLRLNALFSSLCIVTPSPRMSRHGAEEGRGRGTHGSRTTSVDGAVLWDGEVERVSVDVDCWWMWIITQER